MRYAIFSDVHANRQAWEAVLADALEQGTDTLVCLGDVVGYGPKPLEVLNAVRAVTPNFVLGNHDAAACGRLDPSIFNERARIVIEWTRDQLDEEALHFLEQVPLQMDGSEIQFVHAEIMEPGEFGYVDGIGPAELNLKAMTSPLGFLGHTHLPLAYTMPRKGGQVRQMPPTDFVVERGQRYLVNVGSVGEPRTTDVRASYVVYDDVEKTVCFRKVVFDVDAYKVDLAATGLDICPYFVQVVDAGKVAGAPQPTAAPQLALAHLPKVAEVVAGAHGRLVVGTPTFGAGYPAGVHPGTSPMVVARPKSNVGWIVGIAALVAILLAVGVIAAKKLGQGGEMADGSGTGEKAKETGPGKKPHGASALVVDGVEGPIKDLVVRRYARSFQNVTELRAVEEQAEHTQEEVKDGMINLVHAGEGPVGLVWEGYLRVPDRGLYEFQLRASSGASLLIYQEEQALSEGGSRKKARVVLRKGLAPFRLEFFHHEGERNLELRWSGPGLDGDLSLVRTGESTGINLTRRIPDTKDPAIPGPTDPKPKPEDPKPVEPEPDPEPVVKRSAPEKISQELFAYWSFDRREPVESRFHKTPRGVEEKLIAVAQPLRYLKPESDPGRQWVNPDFDANGWAEGLNGLGYEDKPGDFKDVIATVIPGEKDMHPHSVYLRIPFEVENPEDYQGLALFVRYDDGFVAYLNGSVVGSRNTPTPLAWNSGATKQKNDRDALKPEAVKLSDRRVQSLKKGTNVLAIHALNGGGGDPNDTNTGCTGSDMLILPELVGLRKSKELPAGAQPKKPAKHDLVIKKAMINGKVKVDSGRFGEAYKFEGGSLEVGSKNAFAIADNSYTVSLWFTRNPGSTDGQARRLISAGGGSEEKEGWALWIQKDGSGITFRVGDGHAKSDLTAKKESLANGEWHHVAATVDRASNEVHLFIDGLLAVEPQKVKLLEGKTIGSRTGLSIGRNSDDKQHHPGMIDDVALWHRALLPEEIEKIYKAEKAAGEIFEAEE